MKLIPLNIKTEYDLMNSLIKIDELLLYAKNNNINSLGITDSNMFGSYDFIMKCNSNNIKPIIGLPLYINDSNIILYALNYEGYKSLCKIVSFKNISSIPIDINTIKEHSNNLICVSNINDYSIYKDIFKYTYISYNDSNTLKEALLKSDNVVYMDEIKYFNKEDIEYFKYIKYIENDLTINDSLDIKDYYFKDNNNSFDIETTIKFSNLINIEFPKSTYHIPVYKEDSKSFLKALANKGLNKRLNGNVTKEYSDRLEYELSVIEKMNYVDYFLIVYDFILFAKKNNIMVGPGRGSGAASLVNYSLGIINIDPLKYNLIFERFLNPDRITMPDIDVDFDNLKREEVIDYVTHKYGEYNVSRIVSFNTMLPKQIIRDISRVLLINQILIDRLCKTINDEKSFIELENNYSFKNIVSHNEELKKLINICKKICGLKKNTSMHAAGVVISDIPLYDIMPLYKNNGVILSGYSMEYIESLGLLKMDFLSIKNLNTISNILEELKKDGIDINIDNINLDDKKTLYLFKKAYTNGVFQFESEGMKNFLKNLEVDNFNTLVDAIALYRPGPRDMIDEYILRKKGKKKIEYLIPELESILKSTYGIIIYQEQVLEILRKIGGYSYSEADIIRRAMSKKKADIIEKEKDKFTSRVIEKGYSKEIALELYNLIIKFSSYGFNKSHSVVYSLVAFQMAYLKVNYSSYFMKNLLNMNKTSEKIKEYINESKILGIKFNPIDINNSSSEFILKDDHMILPFTLIKSIGINVSEYIVNERNKKEFSSFYDFMIRCYSKVVNKRVVISLIECGAFDIFNLNKKVTINNIEEIINYVSLCKDLNCTLDSEPVFDIEEDYNEKEKIDLEINNYGFYLSFHPVTKYDRNNLFKLDNISVLFNKTITLILFLESFKNIKTKNNEEMSFIKLSDEYNEIEGIIFPESYKKISSIEKNNVYKVTGKIEKRNNTYQLIIYNMIRLDI